jgi:hypothetical protein
MIFPDKTTYSPGQPFVFQAPIALTNAFVAGNVASFDEHNMVGLEISYVKGGETTLLVKVESSIDGGVTYGQQVTQSTTGGTTTIAPNVYSFTAASFPTSQVVNILINPIKGDHLRVSVMYNGGTTPGTVGVRGIFGWV